MGQGDAATNQRRLVVRFIELQVAMALGALVCLLVVTQMASSPGIGAIYRPGTRLFALGDALFLTAPVVVWMVYRDEGWRRGLGLAAAMLAPVGAIAFVGELAGYAYLAWLTTAGYPAMSLGMLAYLSWSSLRRRVA